MAVESASPDVPKGSPSVRSCKAHEVIFEIADLEDPLRPAEEFVHPEGTPLNVQAYCEKCARFLLDQVRLVQQIRGMPGGQRWQVERKYLDLLDGRAPSSRSRWHP